MNRTKHAFPRSSKNVISFPYVKLWILLFQLFLNRYVLRLGKNMDCNTSEMRERNRGWNAEQKVSNPGKRC